MPVHTINVLFPRAKFLGDILLIKHVFCGVITLKEFEATLNAYTFSDNNWSGTSDNVRQLS